MNTPLTLLTEEQRSFVQAVRDFAEKEIKPHVFEMDEASQFRPELLPQLFNMGLMGVEIPESYGGAGGTFFEACLVIEELARVDASVSVLVDVQNTLVINALLNYGTQEQKKNYLPKLASKWVGAYALSESSSGSDAFALQLKAEKVDGGYKLNGHKLWITNAAEASLFIILANIDPSKGYKGITAFLVEKGAEGFQVGKKENKLGIRASSTCELILKDCFIPESQILGPLFKGYKIAIETLNEGRIGIGAQMLGIAQGAYEEALKYTQKRQQFGRAISEFQGVQFTLAEMKTQLVAMRLLVYNAAKMKDAKKDFIQDAAICKLFTSEKAENICSQAVNLFGGNGFSKEYPMEKFYRDVKVGQIYEGTSNMQKIVIAKKELSRSLK